MRRTSSLPADGAGAGQKIADALAHLGHRTVSRDLLEAFCTGAEKPPPVDQVIRVLVQRGCMVFFFSTRGGAYRELVEAGKAPHFAMLEAALKGETWVPPAPPVPAAPPPFAPAPVRLAPVQPAPIPLDAEGRMRFGDDVSPDHRLARLREIAARRRGPMR